MDTTSRDIPLLLHVADLIERHTDQALQEQLGIGMAQFRILECLMSMQDATQRSAAERLGQTEAGVSRQIGILLNKLLIVRKTSTQDRRQNHLKVTGKGAQLHEAAMAITQSIHQKSLSGIQGKADKTLSGSLSKIHDQMCASESCLHRSQNR